MGGAAPRRHRACGITDFAQSALGDVVFVQLPEVGAVLTAGEGLARWSPPSRCRICTRRCRRKWLAINENLEGSPDLVNSDPYGEGWLVDLQRIDGGTLDDDLTALLDPDAFTRHR